MCTYIYDWLVFRMRICVDNRSTVICVSPCGSDWFLGKWLEKIVSFSSLFHWLAFIKFQIKGMMIFFVLFLYLLIVCWFEFGFAWALLNIR